ncbi:unnamed protein product [Paramecium sonneborni]|uniref:Uncharacterized protein n=1 Tax=Paramecium sonneborni TaxID=65129 RepID=A0A8S1LTP8_9CILI|nr:unnamed protein product [Paramecium sonneborni]
MRSNSQQQQSTQQLKETIHKLQQRDASYRLEIAKLKKQLNERDHEYKLAIDELQELKRIQQRDNQYIMKIDNYVMNLKQKLHKANIKIGSLESKLSSSRAKQISSQEDIINNNETFQTEISQISNHQPIIKQQSNRSNQTYASNKPKLICKPVKFQLPYPNTGFTENQDINENCSFIKPSPLQEQILNRILDDEEFSTNLSQKLTQFQSQSFNSQKNKTQPITFICNSRQSNFSFANSEKKPTNLDKIAKGSNRQYHSVSTDDKENTLQYFN